MFSVPVFLHGGDLPGRDYNTWSTISGSSPHCRRRVVPRSRQHCCPMRCPTNPMGENMTRAASNPMLIFPDICRSERTKNVVSSDDCIGDIIAKALMMENLRRIMHTNKDNVDTEGSQDKETNEAGEVSKKSVRKWEHTFDCRGFKSNNVFVKLVNGNLIVSAIKKESSHNGGGIVTRIEKSISLPENVLPGTVRCKMLQDQRLVVKASVTEAEEARCHDAPSFGDTGTSLLEKTKSTDDVTTSDVCDARNADIVNDADNTVNDDIPTREGVMTEIQPEETFLKDDAEDESCSGISDEEEKSFVVILSDGDFSDDVQGETKHTDPNDIQTSSTDKCRETIEDLKSGIDIKELTYCEVPMISNDENRSKEDSEKSLSPADISQSDQQNTHATDIDQHEREEISQPETHHIDTAVEVDDFNLSKEEFRVRFEFPCHQPESIRVTMDDQTRILHIMADKDGTSNAGRVHKVVPVPPEVDELKLSCHFLDGQLSVSAPYKSLSRHTRDIRVVS